MAPPLPEPASWIWGFPRRTGGGRMEKGLDDAFKKVTAPAGVAVVRNRIGISPSPNINPTVHKNKSSGTDG